MKVKTTEKDGVKITIRKQYLVIIESPNLKRTIKGIDTLSEAAKTVVEIMEDYDREAG